MRDIKWFIDQGLRLTPPNGPCGILDTLNELALGECSMFSSLLLDFQFGADSPDQSDEVLFLAHFMRDKMDEKDKADFAAQAARYGLVVLAHPSSIPFYDASILVGIAMITQNAKWLESARQLTPSPEGWSPPMPFPTMIKFGALATLRWFRALRFTEPHTTFTSHRALANFFIEAYMREDPMPAYPPARTLHLYLSTLAFLPQTIKGNMAWIASECANDIAMAGHPLMVSAAVLISSNWDDITPVRPEKQRKKNEERTA